MAYEATEHFQFPEHPDEDGPESDSTAVSPGSLFSEPRSLPSFSPVESEDPFERIQSSSSISSVLERPPLLPRSHTLSQGKLSKLAGFFVAADEPRTRYSDTDIHDISHCLKKLQRHAWSEAPRLYTVLRIIGQVQILDAILEEGISDFWFPFSAASVPKSLSLSLRAEFLETQALVLTKAVDLEKNGTKTHAHFGREDTFPFEVREKLGSGGYATVDKLFSPFSRREFARKRFRRGKGESKVEIVSFKNELKVLKRIQHHHCIELVASYSDSKYFGLIMSPVADCNLAEFYTMVPDDPRHMGILRTFYGCLATGLQFLHSAMIRHRDIKPENILVKGHCIYLTDFGISLDWESLGRGTTTEDTGKSWIYCAPEVANYQPRNESSDIWSLGCVFFEMTTVLKGRSVDAMRQHFKRVNDTHKFHQCLPGINSWSQELAELGLEADNNPLDWATDMMQIDPKSRPSADDLCAGIAKVVGTMDDGVPHFSGECCAIGGDGDSPAGSASDDDVWADKDDVEVISPYTSSPSTDKSIKPVGAKSDTIPKDVPVARDASEASAPTIQITEVRKPIGQSGIRVAELEQCSITTSPLTTKMNLPYPSFSRKHSREAVGSRDNDPNLFLNLGNQQTTDAERAEEPEDEFVEVTEQGAEEKGLETVEVMKAVSTGENSPLGPDVTTELEAGLQKPETSAVKANSERLAADLAAEMTAALQASRSRRLSSSAIVPGERPISMLTVETPSRTNDRRPSSDMQSLRGWQTIGFRNNLPKLGPLSWAKPSHLLDDVKNDMSFMSFLADNYEDCYDLVSVATLKDVTSLVEMLLRNGFQLDAWTYVDAEGISPTFSVLDWGEEYEALFKLMVNSGVNLHYETQDGSNLLSRAASYGYTWALKILVDAGAKLNRNNRRTAMVDAADSDQLETVEYLVNTFQATPDLKTSEGKTALRAASINHHVDIVKFLLETCRDQIDIENRVNDQSILYDACVGDRTEVVELLLAYGADPNATSGVMSGKWTPLQKAAKAGNMDIVRALVAHGADISARALPMVSGAGPLGTTAMIEAKKGGYAEIEKLLANEQDTRAKMRRIKGKKNKHRKTPSKDDEEEYTYTEAVPTLANEQDTPVKVEGLNAKKSKKNKHKKKASKDDEGDEE